MAAKKTDKKKYLEDSLKELLSLMGTKAKAKVTKDKKEDLYFVDIDPKDEAGLLIGRRGETLMSIQTILGASLRQKTGEWSSVVVNVGDWREKQEDYLKNLARETAERVKQTKQPQALYNLTPGQRRVIHLELTNDPDVITESIGEDAERYLEVKPKPKD